MSEQGVPIDEVTAKDFIMVRAALVQRLGGANEALVWSRIEYRSGSAKHAHDTGDGQLWWNASSATLSAETGLTEDQVKHAVKKLRAHGYLLAEHHHGSDRSLSYSPVIAHSADFPDGIPSSTDARSMAHESAVQSALVLDAPSTKTSEDVEDLSSSHADGDDVDPKWTPEIRGVADRIADMVRANGHKVLTVGVTWWRPIEMLVRLDGYTLEQVEIVAKWATADSFWVANIRSTTALRKQFSRLRAQRNSELSKKKPSTMEHGSQVHDILAARSAGGQKAIAS